MTDRVPLDLIGIRVELPTNTPILLLKEQVGDRYLPIWINTPEATSIALARDGYTPQRPMTHDLFKNFSDLLSISISKIEVCDLRDNTFFAKIYFISKDGKFEMDSRPSDAIALALRFDAPIYVADEVMQKSKIGDSEAEVLDTSEEGKKWADYLESLSPEDFGKFKV